VVLPEDFAAPTDLALELVFVGLTAVTGAPLYDAIGSICIGIVLVIVSIFMSCRITRRLVGFS